MQRQNILWGVWYKSFTLVCHNPSFKKCDSLFSKSEFDPIQSFEDVRSDESLANVYPTRTKADTQRNQQVVWGAPLFAQKWYNDWCWNSKVKKKQLELEKIGTYKELDKLTLGRLGAVVITSDEWENKVRAREDAEKKQKERIEEQKRTREENKAKKIQADAEQQRKK